MKFKGVRKIHQGKFITRYDLEYETEDGNEKIYEMISRSPEIKSFDDLCSSRADAVVMIIHDENGEKLLLNREYRMATGQWIINFPAGLIDPGETADIAAQRELHEETGLRLLHIDEVWKESYSAIGFSNEKTIVVIGTASGEIGQSDSDVEEIEARWYTKEEIRKLIITDNFAARTQAYCVLWSRE